MIYTYQIITTNMDQNKPKDMKKVRNFSVTYTGDMEAMTNYIMDRTGVTSRSQVFAMSIRQYYLALKEDERIKATRTV